MRRDNADSHAETKEALQDADRSQFAGHNGDSDLSASDTNDDINVYREPVARTVVTNNHRYTYSDGYLAAVCIHRYGCSAAKLALNFCRFLAERAPTDG